VCPEHSQVSIYSLRFDCGSGLWEQNSYNIFILSFSLKYNLALLTFASIIKWKKFKTLYENSIILHPDSYFAALLSVFSLSSLEYPIDKGSNLHLPFFHWLTLPYKFFWIFLYRCSFSLFWEHSHGQQSLWRDRGEPLWPILLWHAKWYIFYCGIVHGGWWVDLNEPNFVVIVYHEIISKKLMRVFSILYTV